MTKNNTDSTFHNAKFDKDDSYYMQEIKFINGKEIVGYSKKIGYAEKNDKDSLLGNWICRMYKDGYLDFTNETKDEIEYIKYYQNNVDEKGTNLLMLTLGYDYPVIEDLTLLTEKMARFLESFYHYVETQPTKVYQLLYDSKRQKIEDKFDTTKKRFLTKSHLEKYCRNLVEKNPKDRETIEDFWRKYIHAHFSKKKNINEDNTSSISNIIQDAQKISNTGKKIEKTGKKLKKLAKKHGEK